MKLKKIFYSLSSKTRYLITSATYFLGGLLLFIGIMWLCIHFTKGYIEGNQEKKKQSQAYASERVMVNLSDSNINKETIITLIASYNLLSAMKVRDDFENLPSDKKEYILSGEHSMDEISDMIYPDTAKDGDWTDSKSAKEIVSRIYDLRNEYVSKLDAICESAKAKAKAIPEQDRTTEVISGIAEDAIKEGTTLEGQCDAKMNFLLKNLKTVLEAENRSISIVDEIERIYTEQKRIKKNQLMEVNYF